MGNKPSFKGTIAEMENDKRLTDLMENRRIELLNRQVAKINIQTVIGWCRDMAMKARKQPGKELFAERCDQVVSDMIHVSEEYKAMERELEVSRQRNMDLERQLIMMKIAGDNMQSIIEKMGSELTSNFNSDGIDEGKLKEITGFNILG